MQLLGWTCICAAATVTLLPTTEATQVQMRRGGYEGVVVAISPEVPESQNLVDAIKRKITAASRLLFNATRNTVFFKTVTILLPRTWRNTKPDLYSGNFSYEESDIRVALANPIYGHQPYTLQPGECGRPGKFSHFTSEFLTDKNLSLVWGPPERLMVLEWAKLRWGVFEEVGYRGDEQFPLYYRHYFDGEDDYDDDGEGENSDGGENNGLGVEKDLWRKAATKREAPAEEEARLTANLCVVGDVGGRYVASQTGENCSQQGENCDFLVKDFRANLWPASLDEEARQSIDVAFCDDEEHSAYRHNEQAPSKHNLRCHGESWWSVMRRHPDFNETPSGQNTFEETKYTVVQQVDARVVIVVDLTNPTTVSTSLAFAYRWLHEGAEDGSYLGVVLILPGNKNAECVAEMTRITLASRLKVIRALERRADDARNEVTSQPTASIRKGLHKASKMLANNIYGNAVIVLVCSTAAYERDLVDLDGDWNTPIYAISLVTSDALKKFVEGTRGKFIFFNDTPDEDRQREVVVGVASYVSQPRAPPSEAPISFQNETIWGKTEDSSVQIDDTSGTLVFRLSTNNRNHVLEPPTVHLQQSPGIPYQATLRAGSFLNQWTMVVDDVSAKEPQTWVWRVNTTDDADSFVRLETLRVLEADQGPVIQVDSWIDPISGPDGVAEASEGVFLYAKVMKGEMPVLGANVEAYVSSAENRSFKQHLQLRDSGTGADSQGEDGLYSCFFPLFASGNFSVEVKVTSNDETKVPQVVPEERSLKLSRQVCCGSTFPSSIKTYPVPFLNRMSYAGMITNNYYSEDDRIPPSRVTNLRAKEVALSGFYVRVLLAWTASGDDRDFGQASRYTVRASPRRRPVKAETCADACEKLEPEFEAEAASPPAGQRVVTASVLLPSHGHGHFFFAVIAQDEVGNVSPPSNVVAVDMRGNLFREWQKWGEILLWVMAGMLIAVGLATPLLLVCGRH